MQSDCTGGSKARGNLHSGEVAIYSYRCDSVIRPTVDQVDAMLCAVAGQAAVEGSGFMETFGREPVVDEEEGFLREGFIVCPAKQG